MTDAPAETRSVVVERIMAFPPERIWRALTQSELIGEWLMPTDFEPREGHDFKFSADWGAVECRVLAVDPERVLTYTWVGLGLESIVTWTLTPTKTGTRVRMEQTGFLPGQQRAYMGATAGWPRFIDKLERVLTTLP